MSEAAIRPPIDAVIDLDEYPLQAPNSRRYKDLVARCRESLRQTGCACVPDFLRPDALSAACTMVRARAHLTHKPRNLVTPYGGPNDDDYPDGHPRRSRTLRGGGFICADQLDPTDGLWTFFDWSETTRFMTDVFEITPLYQYADPLSNMAINAMWEGDVFPWHFDTNEMTVSLLLDKPRGGGLFQFFPNIRSPDNENYDAVARILEGDLEGMHTLELNPGDMQLFQGRYTLHRVSPVEGPDPRYIALPSWSSQPGQVGTIERMVNSYGRALPIHYEQASQSPDSLAH